MDSRASHEVVADVFKYCKPKDVIRRRSNAPQKDQSKRYGTYFPSRASFETKWNFTDDESTWEFSAPVAHYPRSYSTNTSSSSSSKSTPAQQIVLRYRAGLPPLIRATSSSSTQTSSESDESFTTAPSDGASTAPSEISASAVEIVGVKPLFRQSRYDALANTLVEARAVMKQYGKNERDTIMCHRPGCRDAITGVKALMYHLHIHNIHDQSLRCDLCIQNFDSDVQLSSHRCRRKASCHTAHPKFLKAGLWRVLSKLAITCPGFTDSH